MSLLNRTNNLKDEQILLQQFLLLKDERANVLSFVTEIIQNFNSKTM